MTNSALAIALDRLVAAATRERTATATTLDGVTATDLLALSWLWREGPITPAELGRALLVSPSGASGVIRRLVASGLAERSAAPANHRDVRVSATAEGTRLASARAAELAGEQGVEEGIVLVLGDLARRAERRADAVLEGVERADRRAHGVPNPVLWG